MFLPVNAMVRVFNNVKRWRCTCRTGSRRRSIDTVARKQEAEERVLSVISFIGEFRTRRVRSPSRGVEMHLTPTTLYALRLSLNQGAASSMFRKNVAKRNTATSAYVLATVGLSMSMFSVKKMLTSKHRSHLH